MAALKSGVKALPALGAPALLLGGMTHAQAYADALRAACAAFPC